MGRDVHDEGLAKATRACCHISTCLRPLADSHSGRDNAQVHLQRCRAFSRKMSIASLLSWRL